MKIIKGIEKIRKDLIERFREYSFIYSMIIFLEIYFCIFISEIYLTGTLILRIIFYMLFLFLQNIMHKFIFYTMFILYFITLISYNVSLEMALSSQGILITLLLIFFLINNILESIKALGYIRSGIFLVMAILIIFIENKNWTIITLYIGSFMFLLENLEKRNKIVKFLNERAKIKGIQQQIIKETEYNKGVYNFILFRIKISLLLVYLSNVLVEKLVFINVNGIEVNLYEFNNLPQILVLTEAITQSISQSISQSITKGIIKVIIIVILGVIQMAIEKLLFKEIKFKD